VTFKNHIGKISAVFLTMLLVVNVVCALWPSFYYQTQAADRTGRYDEITPDYYYVTFNDWDGSELKVIRVPKYYDAIPPVDPSREGYTFVGWDQDFSSVQHDMIITAQYTSDELAQASLLGLWIWLGVLAVSVTAFIFIKKQEKKLLYTKEKNKEQHNDLRQNNK